MTTPAINSTSEWKLYTNNDFGFSLKYNPTITPNVLINNLDKITGSGQQIALITFGLLKNNGFEVEITSGDNIEYYKNQIDEFIAKIDKEEKIAVDGVTATKLTYKQVVVIDKFNVSKVIVNKNNRDYLITALSSDIDQILSTFKFTD